MLKFEDYSNLVEAVRNFNTDCCALYRDIGDESLVKVSQTHSAGFSSARFSISVLGNYNKGKSTLLNALMERHTDELSPVANHACTASIIEYRDVSILGHVKESAYVFFEDGAKKKIELADVVNFAYEKKNKNNKNRVDRIEVYGDFPEWSKTITFTDTPGLNSIMEYHDELVLTHLKEADALLVVFSAERPLDDKDKKLLELLKANQYERKVFFVLNKIDKLPPNKLEICIDSIKATLISKGFVDFCLYKVSAKPVFDALKEHADNETIHDLKKVHGIVQLENDLEAYVKKSTYLKDRFSKILKLHASQLKVYLKEFKKVIAAGEADCEKLKSEYSEIIHLCNLKKAESESALQAFEKDWQSNEDDFVGKIKEILPKIRKSFEEQIKNNNIFQNLRLRRRFHEDACPMFKGEISSLYETHIQKQKQVAEKLKEELQTNMEQCDDKGDIDLSITNDNGEIIATFAIAGGSIASAITCYCVASATVVWWQAQGMALAATQAQGVAMAFLGYLGFATKAVTMLKKLEKARRILMWTNVWAVVAQVFIWAGYCLAHFVLRKKLKKSIDDVLNKAMDDFSKKHKEDFNNLKNKIRETYDEELERFFSGKKKHKENLADYIENKLPEKEKIITERCHAAERLFKNSNQLLAELHRM